MAVTLTEAAARHVSRFIAKRGKGVGVFELVGQARAAGRLDAQAHADALAACGDEARDMARGGFGESDCHTGFSWGSGQCWRAL